MKICRVCEQVKPLVEFSKDRKYIDGLDRACKLCASKIARAYRKSENWQKNRLKYQLKRYNITVEDYEQLLKDQNFVCAICGEDETREKFGRLSVDHDHTTGKVRGLLCNNCNRSIGLLKDDHRILDKASAYLKNH